ncbi:hypothetical protein [Acinetobacter bereziniae]|uniref:hypothetical protein n=1 Tax=Acinetobacter bereziniae TaxID=106648 RepID=UPI0018FFFB24|nr:hypothetical protein [Acinetobacter bereziniae]MBJ8552668.1 hypothetical protein [Acinetobacter bereziniae]
MELSQPTQTFLLLYFVFLISLIGIALFINNNKKLPEISLANAVQTSILFTGFFTLLVFGASYYFVLSDSLPSSQPLKDALSITASFFGGFATLTAAYIASKLFNDWREQKKYEIISNLSLETYMEFINAKDQLQLYLFQENYEIKMEFSDIDTAMFKAITKLNLLDNVLIKFNFPTIKNLIVKFYLGNYCKIDNKYKSIENLSKTNIEERLKFNKNLDDDAELLIENLLKCIALINKE